MSELMGVISSAIRVPTDQLGDDTCMQDVAAWDSLAHMELIAEIENRYKVELDADEIVSMTRIGRIREVLADKGIAAA